MKLYLSSYGLGDHPQRLADQVGVNNKVAVIANARDFSTDIRRRSEGVKTEIRNLRALGLQANEVDLRNYFHRPRELAKELEKYGMVWVIGGNTFILRKALKESGMDKWLISQKDNENFVYAGYSAGVCVLSPSLRGLELVDDPHRTADGYNQETVWEGLGLIDFAIAPHYHSDHPESKMIDKVVDYYVTTGIKHRTLHDGEVIILGS